MGISQINKANSYGEKMKLELKISNLNGELNNIRALLGQLDIGEGVYASHRVTGIVYDVKVLEGRMQSVEGEIKYYENLLK